MDNKRIILATALAFFVMLAYSYYTKNSVPLTAKDVLLQKEQAEHVIQHDTHDTLSYDTVVIDNAQNDTVYENEYVRFVLNRATGVIKEVLLKEHSSLIHLYPLANKGLGLLMPTVSTVSFQHLQEQDRSGIVLQSNGKSREYILTGHVLQTTFRGENTIQLYMPVHTEESKQDARYIRLLVKDSSGLTHNVKINRALKQAASFDNAAWVALSFKHHSLLFDPDITASVTINPHTSKEGFIITIKSNKDNLILKSYFGPNYSPILSKIDDNWSSLLDYGVLNNTMKGMLTICYRLTRNYGLAIIVLALFFNMLFAPLTIKSYRSMKKMQGLQPHMQALKEQYKDNPQAINKEMMALYKQHNVNPMGGCLPMLLQIPVFIALYNTLMRSYELKNATFLWVKDLSVPDKLLTLPQALPFIGSDFNLLPVLMAVLMFVQQKMSPTPKSSGAAMPSLWFLPIIFGVIFYKFPAGLVLYWFTNSLSMLVLQNIGRK
ncbi:MAG: membrane protein insertase YidC [Candidatus Omnitrophica bacterium]|nr:membrane protein insertase YidC [Candidatus Omnitrophota bacterium]